LGTDKYTDAVGALGSSQQVYHTPLGLEGVEQRSYAFEVFNRAQILQKVSVAAHDQLPLIVFAARPAGKAGRNDLLRQLIEFGLPFGDRLLNFSLKIGQRLASDARIEKVRRFSE